MIHLLNNNCMIRIIQDINIRNTIKFIDGWEGGGGGVVEFDATGIT